MGRPKSLQEECAYPTDCTATVRSRIYCATHFEAWRRRYANDRCDWADCSTIVAKDDWYQQRRPADGKLSKIDGRTMDTGNGRLSFCRRHEVEHLRPSAAVEMLNRQRLGAGLEPVGECWRPKDSIPSLSNGAGLFDPEGSNGKVYWAYHRAVWDLLMGGHAQRRELDHLTGCAIQARCANPAHIQPVTHDMNMARRKARNTARRKGKPFDPKTSGPPINRDAAEAPAVVSFAQEHGLPLPALGKSLPL